MEKGDGKVVPEMTPALVSQCKSSKLGFKNNGFTKNCRVFQIEGERECATAGGSKRAWNQVMPSGGEKSRERQAGATS